MRKIYIDYLRVISCLAVVLNHIFTTAHSYFNHNLSEEITTNFFIMLLHYAVPIFFMITGTLFLNKNKKISVKKLFKKYILRYFIVIFTFGFAFSIIEEFMKGNHSFNLIVNAFYNTIIGNSWNHMWYLYTLIGVMIMIPIVKALIEKNIKITKYLLAVLLTSSFVYPLVKNILKIDIPFVIPLASEYLTYTVIGYFLDNEIIKMNNKKAIAGIVISIIAIVGLMYYNMKLFNNIPTEIGEYNSPITLILSVSIFMLLKNIKYDKKIKMGGMVEKLITIISRDSFGIYIIHMLYINIIYKFFNANLYGSYFIIKIFIFWFGTVIASLCTTELFKKIPLLKKIV